MVLSTDQGDAPAQPSVARVSNRGMVGLALFVGLLEQIGRFLPAQLPRQHLDISWMMGLDLARDRGLKFGSDLVFTYGPWGFLASPTGIDVGSQVASGLIRILAVGFLFIVLVETLRASRWRVAAACVLALLISNGGQPDWIVLIGILVWVLTCVSRKTPPPLWTIALATGVGAFLFQVKFTVGLMVVVLVGLLVLASHRRVVSASVATGSFLATFVLFWLVAGQSLATLPRWLRLGWEVISGYSDAMAYYDTNFLMVVMVVAVLIGAVVAATTRRVGWVARIGFLGALLFFAKLALSLPDGGHLIPGYAGVAAVTAVLLGLPLARVARACALVSISCLCLMLTIGSPVIPKRTMQFGAPAALTAEGRTDRLVAAREQLIRDLDVSPDVLAALRGHPVSVDPWEISAVWAYDLDWRPLTIFQQYSAYTPTLDRENAADLLEDPTHRVLRERVSDHDYNPVWVTPAYTLALLCNFTSVAADGHWVALARGEDRCGDERSVSTQTVSAGEEVSLDPSSTSLVAVRFDPEPRSLTDRVLGISGIQRNLLHATVDGEDYRVTEALAGGPLILGSPDPEPVLFDLDSASTISFDRAGELEVIEIPLLGRESE